MVTYELRRRLTAHAPTVAVAAHPGMSDTELVRNSPALIRLPLTWLAPLIAQNASMGALAQKINLSAVEVVGQTHTGVHARLSAVIYLARARRRSFISSRCIGSVGLGSNVASRR